MMKFIRLLIPAVLVCCSTLLHAQADEAFKPALPATRNSAIEVIPFLGISGGGISAVGVPANTLHFEHYYEGGINLRYRIGRHFSILSGIEYANLRDHSGPYFLESNFDPLTGTFVGEPLNIWYTYHLLRLPLMASFEYSQGPQLTLSAAAGLNFNYLLAARGSYTADPNFDLLFNEAKDFNRFRVGFSAQLSASWQCNKHISILLSPAYNFTSLKVKRASSAEDFSVWGGRLGVGIRL